MWFILGSGSLIGGLEAFDLCLMPFAVKAVALDAMR